MTRARKPVAVVAEDDPILRLDACQSLEAAGFEVLDACDAPSALAAFADHEVDVLFTDLQMPGPYGGLDLARRVHERWPRVRLFLTSGALRLERDEIPDDGKFVAKPYHIESVVQEMRAAVG